jgi:NAD(P)-dependent dehydrogenase (short-subunit alcohol dehydrogenase family)
VTTTDKPAAPPVDLQRIREFQAAGDYLADRVILVTGAGGGIGGALARACAAHGARVILCGRTVKKLEGVYDAIQAQGGPRPSIAQIDFERADATQYAALVDATRNEFGRLDGLVHCAAQLGELSPIEHYDVVTWLRTMHVNVNAAFILTQSLLPLLRASSDASIIFTGSGLSVRGRAYWGAYAASKFALEALMQVLAEETENLTRIRVNSVNPGRTRTRMRAQAFPGEDPATLPEPTHVLAPFLFLLGAQAAGITGQRVDAQ